MKKITVDREVQINEDVILEKGDTISLVESQTRSSIGSGRADIFRDSFKDSLAYFRNQTEVYVAQDLTDGIIKEAAGRYTVLVIDGPKNILWAVPIINGELKLGMSSGSFIYTPNNAVMRGYPHPIRLMDRFE